MKKLLFPAALVAFLAVAFGASAETVYEGMAKPWQLGFQEPATPVMERLNTMHDFLVVVIIAISVLVLIGLTYICVRFRRSANPVASKTTHNSVVAVAEPAAIPRRGCNAADTHFLNNSLLGN